MAYLTENNDDALNLVLKADFIFLVKDLINDSLPTVKAPAIRIYGNYISSSDSYTQKIKDMGIFLEIFPSALNNSCYAVTKEACWLLSNLFGNIYLARQFL